MKRNSSRPQGPRAANKSTPRVELDGFLRKRRIGPEIRQQPVYGRKLDFFFSHHRHGWLTTLEKRTMRKTP